MRSSESKEIRNVIGYLGRMMGLVVVVWLLPAYVLTRMGVI